MRFLARDCGIAESWRPFRAPTNHTFETRGAAPGCYPPALSAPKHRINRAGSIARLIASKHFTSSQTSCGPTCKTRPLFLRMQGELLHAPVQQFAYENLVFRRASDFVNPAKLFELLAGFAEHAENFSVQADLVDPAGGCVRSVEHLIWRRGDANCPRGAWTHRADQISTGLVAEGWDGIRIVEGLADLDLAERFSVAVKHFDAGIAAMRHVDISLRVRRDAMWSVELSGLVAGLPKRFQPLAVLVDFRDARI